MADEAYTPEQMKIMEKIRGEAFKQKVPVEFALANADLESSFKNLQNAAGGKSFGPMQVNVVNLKPGETLAKLKNLDFNIKRGVEILRRYLVKANGDTFKARILYFCGPGLCRGKPPEKLIIRWRAAAQKWNVPDKYSQFMSIV